jgi:hypothetical protein
MATRAGTLLGMDVRRAFGISRMAVGGFTWLAPRASGHAFGLGDLGADSRAAVVARLFGARDLMLGAAVVAANEPEALQSALALGVAVDLLDVIATVLGVRRGVSKHAAVGVGVGAAAFAACGIALLVRGEPSRPPIGGV